MVIVLMVIVLMVIVLMVMTEDVDGNNSGVYPVNRLYAIDAYKRQYVKPR